MDLFTSDSHFDHGNIIKFCNRPFNNVYEMNSKMIQDWNSVVTPNDTVWHLGDFSMHGPTNAKKVVDILSQLNGTINLVYGNHDVKSLWKSINLPNLNLVGERVEIKCGGVDLTLSHFPHAAWNKSHFGSLHVFGHTHNQFKGLGKSMDVGVDAKYAMYGNWAPFTLNEITTHLETREIYRG